MKVRQVLVLDEVADDLKEGSNFYDKKEPGIGEYFFDCIISDIESLLTYAGIHTKYYGFYRMPSSRFPFAIYYTLLEDIAIVAAVLDMRRKPSLIQKKLKNRIK